MSTYILKIYPDYDEGIKYISFESEESPGSIKSRITPIINECANKLRISTQSSRNKEEEKLQNKMFSQALDMFVSIAGTRLKASTFVHCDGQIAKFEIMTIAQFIDTTSITKCHYRK